MNRHTAGLFLVLVYATLFRLDVLNRPFLYDPEGSGCLNGVLARGYLRVGWAETHGMPVLTVGDSPAGSIVFYPDHPPLMPLMIVPFYAWFGTGAWQTRLPTALLTIGALASLYALLASVSAPRTGAIAAAIFAATPMTLYFGGFPDVVGMPLILFVLLTMHAYLRFHVSPGRGTLARLLAAFTLAGLCDWPAYMVVPVFVLHFITTHRRREWRWILAFCCAASAVFIALYVYITLATHAPWNWMVPLFSRRSAMVGGRRFTWRQWVAASLAVNRSYHTLAPIAAAGLWAVVYGFRRRQGAATLARLLLGWAAIYTFVGSKALYDHEWPWMVLTPGISVAAALLIDELLMQAERWRLGALAGWSVGACLALFGGWTAYSTLLRLEHGGRIAPFTPMEMGQAVQAAAPRTSDVALLVGGEEADAQLWFYGDRAVRTKVWTVQEFERRLNGDTVDLVYNFDEQPWPGRAAGLVFPRPRERQYTALRDYVSRRYPRVPLPVDLAEKFEVFDLRVTNERP